MQRPHDRVIFERPDFDDLRERGLMYADLHVHTNWSHDCQSKPHHVRHYLRQRDLGVAVTDHNEYRGSLAFSRYDDLFVVPGIEVTTVNNKDILLYFHSPGDLKAFGEKYVDGRRLHKSKALVNKLPYGFLDMIDNALEFNALVCLPHPLGRLKGSYYWLYDSLHHVAMRDVHAIEVINGSQRLKRNIKSLNWSARENKAWTGGSDSHIVRTIGDVLTMANAEKPGDFLEEIHHRRNHVMGMKTKLRREFLTALTIMKNKL